MLLIALTLRIAACGLWADDLTRDRDAYLGIARNVSAGNGFCTPETTTPTAFRPPVYPLLLGACLLVLPESLAVATVNIAAGLATVWAVWFLAELWWQPSRGQKVMAAMLIAADPLLLRYTPQPMTECVFTALTAWTIVGLSRLLHQSHDRQGVSFSSPGLGTRSLTVAALTGLLAGLAILCRPTLLPFIGLITVILLAPAVLRKVHQPVGACPRLISKKPDASEFRLMTFETASRFAVGWVVLLGMWAGRNFVVMSHPILTTTHGGYTLLLGNNPVFYNEVARKPWGTVWSHDSLVHWQASLAEQMQRDLGDQVDEVAADEWHVRQATHAMHDDPDGFHAAVWYRIRSFWSLTPRGPEVTANRLMIVIAIWYAVLFLLAMIGFVIAVMRRHSAALLGGLLIATVATLHLIYWTDTRMRAPLHPVFAAFAVGAMSKLRSRKPAIEVTAVTP